MITKKVRNPSATFFTMLVVVSMLWGSLPSVHAQQSDLGWKDPVNLSKSGSSTNPVLVVDSKGVIHVAWVDQYDGYKYAESKDGTTWSAPSIVNFPFSPKNDSLPTLIAGSNGVIHIFWRDKENTLHYRQANSENFGKPDSWGQSAELTVSAADFKAVVDQQGVLHVSYIKSLSKGQDNKLPGVYYTRLAGGWSAPVNLYASQYFRAIDPQAAHVRVAVSRDSEIKNVYVAWDDPAQKRIFMAKSVDGGSKWGTANEAVGPDPDLGYSTPERVEINTFHDNVFLTWQVGNVGSRCAQFSKSSADGGNQWSNSIRIFSDVPVCPQASEYIAVDNDYSITMLNIQDSLAMTAWNGIDWGAIQIQNEFTAFSNPATFDPILFRCQQASFYNDALFVVGCDQGSSGDIWFTSRSLGSLENWFPPASAWTAPAVLVSAPQKMSDMVSVADETNRTHMVWVQSALSEKDNYQPAIQYIRWDGVKWSKPVSIITDLTGLPTQLTLTIDNQGRLLLGWVDQTNGDLRFSWADAGRANIPIEWSQSIVLPTPSSLIRSPHILVDSAGTIVVTYAVYVNEARGVYVTLSSDLGVSWSTPALAFDASSAGWEMVDQPKISLTADGALQLLFGQYALSNTGYNPVGLYYSRSYDEGATWSEAEVVENRPVQWSEIISDGQSLHRLWQVKDETATAIYHQFSKDGGVTWESKTAISSAFTKATRASLAMNANGNLYFTQIADHEILNLQDWKWNNFLWDSQTPKAINVLDYATLLDTQSVITTDGYLSIFFIIENKNLEYSLVSVQRALDSLDTSRVLPQAVIATTASLVTPAPGASVDANSTLAPAPTIVPPLAGLNAAPSTTKKNVIGVLLVALVIMILLITVRRKPGKS